MLAMTHVFSFPQLFYSDMCISPYQKKKIILLKGIWSMKKNVRNKIIYGSPLSSGFRPEMCVLTLVWEWLMAAEKPCWPPKLFSFTM